MNNTNVLELWYLTDVDVSSYTGHYDMQIAYWFGLYLYRQTSWPTPDCGQLSFKTFFKSFLSRILRHLLSRLLRHPLSRLLGRLCYCVQCHLFFHLLLLFLTLLLLVVF